MLFHSYTKLTGLISALGEKFAINSGIWTETDDLKIAWGDITISAGGGAVINASDGITAAVREEAGVCTVTYDGTFDEVPTVICQAITSDVTADVRPMGVVSDGVAADRERSEDEQTLLRFDEDGNLEDGQFVFIAIGVDSDTTLITDNNDGTPLTAASLNRIVAIGDYQCPLNDDVVPMLSGCFTETDANAGDTINTNLANMADANHTRNDAGDYTTEYTTAYTDSVSMHPLVTPITNDACQQGQADSTTTQADVTITDGTDDTEEDGNYCLLMLGMAEVA